MVRVRKVSILYMSMFLFVVTACCNADVGFYKATISFQLKPSLNPSTSYQIFVSLPKDYDLNPEKRFNTVYITDANWRLNTALPIMDRLIGQKKIEPVIIVGICPIQAYFPSVYNYDGSMFYRCRDFTPTKAKGYPGSGTAQKFAEFIKVDLIPRIDSNYRTVSSAENRCLVGQSLGGLFAYYILFNYNDTFKKVLAASSAIWWDNCTMLTTEADYAKNHNDLDAVLYTSIGTQEDSMLPVEQMMVNQLKSRQYPSFTIFSEILPCEHIQSFAPSYERGLPLLFGK